jgi:steroid delta-isomerase-like uncharacterized protein
MAIEPEFNARPRRGAGRRGTEDLERRNLRSFLAAKAAFNEKDISRCMTFYAPDHHIRSQPSGPGREHIARFLSLLQESWSDLNVTVERAITQDDWLAAWCSVTATHSRTVHGIPPTHRCIATTFWEMHRFNADGLIAESWNLIDGLAILQQLVIISPPKSGEQ